LSDPSIRLLVWLAVLLHTIVGLLVWRRPNLFPLVSLLQAIYAFGVLAYWAQRWYGYLFRGITWYATDQLFPLYALIVLCLAVASLAGRPGFTLPLWVIYWVHALVLGVAVWVVTSFRITRLI